MTAHSFSPRRELGRTGFVATSLGIGDIADRSVGAPTLVATLTRALDAGLNLIDTAPNYEDGYSEEIVGAALRSRRRDGVFLIEKGTITRALRNFRWNESPLLMLNRLEAIGRSESTQAGLIMPALRIRDFNFTSSSDAV